MMYREHSLNELDEHWNGSAPQAKVQLYLQQTSPEIEAGRRLPCMVICPGGGYGFTSDREAEPVALRFAALGYQVAVVRYSVAPFTWPVPLCEVSLVMAYLRRNAQSLQLNPDKIAVCGFSAGGHLAGSLANLHGLPQIAAALGLQPGENKPNAAVLCYPVITSGPKAHRGSFDNLLAGITEEEVLRITSLEHSVHADCPPCFLWHTADDTAVPVENSLLYAQALSACHIPYELHIYPHGPHGLSLASRTTAGNDALVQPTVAEWFNLCAAFLDRVFA